MNIHEYLRFVHDNIRFFVYAVDMKILLDKSPLPCANEHVNGEYILSTLLLLN